MPHQPLIGIWWDDGHRLAVYSHAWSEHASGETIRDSNLQHTDLWLQAAKKLGVSQAREYFETPRGRVMFDQTNDQGIILHGNATTPVRLELIASHFRLTRWTSRLDEHYLVGSILNYLFSDFDDGEDE